MGRNEITLMPEASEIYWKPKRVGKVAYSLGGRHSHIADTMRYWWLSHIEGEKRKWDRLDYFREHHPRVYQELILEQIRKVEL